MCSPLCVVNICYHKILASFVLVSCVHVTVSTWRCCTQHQTLACLADVVDYFVAKAGPPARPLQVDPAALMMESLSPGSPPSRHLHSGAATVGRAQLSHAAGTPSSAASQFVYDNNLVTMPSSPSSLGSNGHSDHTLSSSSPSPAAVTSSVTSSSSQTHLPPTVSADSMNSSLHVF